MKMSIEFRSLALPAVLAVGVFCAVPSAPSCPPLPPLVTITATDTNAAEIGPDTGTFAVTRTGGDQSGELTVYYNIGGTATNSVDYQMLSGWVQIPAGTNTAIVTVTPILDLDSSEGSETVALTVADNAYYDVGTPSSATVTIADVPVDSDNDGLTDSQEAYLGTNPNNADTDGDGVGDGLEVLQGRNPLVAGAVPDSNNLINLQVYSPLK